MPAGITGLHAGYAIDGQEYRLDAPETTASQNDSLLTLCRWQILPGIRETASGYLQT